jgi:triosephosphate isomerase (TIM)
MLVAGNWKMNTDLTAARQLASAVVSAVGNPSGVDVALCPPFVSLDSVFSAVHGSPVRVGAQDMHWEDAGAFTSAVSASMLRSVGCHYVILGHSERREYFGETDATVNRKTLKAIANKLVPIVCVGEVLEQRDAGQQNDVVATQIRRGLEDVAIDYPDALVVAYEPVWAIGTGRTASPEQAEAMHGHIRSLLGELFGSEIAGGVKILYGGSMKPGNAADLLARKDVDGGLIGGAALSAPDFAAIVRAAEEA